MVFDDLNNLYLSESVVVVHRLLVAQRKFNFRPLSKVFRRNALCSLPLFFRQRVESRVQHLRVVLVGMLAKFVMVG